MKNLLCVLVLATAPHLSYALEEAPRGELIEVRLEGSGVKNPVSLELAFPQSGIAPQVVPSLAQSMTEALRNCPGFSSLVRSAKDAIEFQIFFERGVLSETHTQHLDDQGVLRCAMKKIKAGKTVSKAIQVENLQALLRVRPSEA